MGIKNKKVIKVHKAKLAIVYKTHCIYQYILWYSKKRVKVFYESIIQITQIEYHKHSFYQIYNWNV